jgi:hypothetical protein
MIVSIESERLTRNERIIMTKKLVDIGPAMKKICDIGKAYPRIEPAQVAAALGAEAVPDAAANGGSPLTLFAVRQEIARRLQSTSVARPVKIPLNAQQWQQLETVAAAIADAGCAPSADQVAGVLLNLALRSALAGLAESPITKEQLRDRLADAKS